MVVLETGRPMPGFLVDNPESYAGEGEHAHVKGASLHSETQEVKSHRWRPQLRTTPIEKPPWKKDRPESHVSEGPKQSYHILDLYHGTSIQALPSILEGGG